MRKDPRPEIELFDILKPLSWDLWILMIGTLIFTSILMCVLEKKANEKLREKSVIAAFAVCIWYSCCNFMGRDIELQPKTVAGRLLSTAMFFLTLVLIASYTANLASELTISKSQSIISGVDDLKTGKIPFSRIGIRVGAASAAYFLSEISGGNANYSPLYSRQQQYDSLLNYAIDVAFLDTGVAQYITNNIYCNLTIVGDGFDAGSFGIAMPKGWLYANDLDVALLLLRESGALEDLNRKWFQYKQCPDDQAESDAIESRSLIGLFMLFGIACVLSILIFVLDAIRITERLPKCIGRIFKSAKKARSSERELTTRSTNNFELGELQTVRVEFF